MIHLVLSALRTARPANFSALATYRVGELRIPRHPTGCGGTDVGTVSIQRDTPGHHLDIFFMQAGRCAMFALLHTFETCLDAGFIFFVSHFDLLFGLWLKIDVSELELNPRRLLGTPVSGPEKSTNIVSWNRGSDSSFLQVLFALEPRYA